MSRAPIPNRIRAAILERAANHCEICGRTLTSPADFHHRQRYQIGGHSVENIIVVHRACHDFAHQHPDWAREAGFIVSAYADLP